MATIKISALPNVSALTGAEQVPVNQGGVTSKTTLSAISTFLSPACQCSNAGTGTTVGNTITKLTLDFTTFDTNSMANLALHEIEIKTAGIYQVSIAASWDPMTAQVGLYARKNGAGSVAAAVMPASALANSISALGTVELIVGDKLTLWALVYSPASPATIIGGITVVKVA